MNADDYGPSALTEEELTVLRQKLTGAVQKVCPSWLWTFKDDIVQVGLLRVLEVERKSETKRSFSSSYLWMTAYSAVVDEIRRHRRRREVPMQEEIGDHRASARPNPERDVVGRQIGQAILACLQTLVLPRRRAVTLHLRGYRVNQVAEFLGWDGKRAKNLIFRGRQDLRKCLERKGYAL